jgi:phage terminase small subunit
VTFVLQVITNKEYFRVESEIMDSDLSPNHLRFIAEYLAESPRNATAAYLRVYTCAYDSARSAAAALLANPRVKAEVERREAMLQKNLQLTAEDVLREIFLVASADPRELTEFHIGSCRHCHGERHQYQRTPAEFDADLKEHIKNRAKSDPDPLGLDFDLKGGVGFNPYRDPHSECPECFGKGVGYERFKDTRTLSPAAARLFEGVKRTKDGLEIKIRNREKSLDLAAQHLGISRQKVELTGKNGGPLQSVAAVSFKDIDPTTASQVYKNIMEGS